MNKITGKYKAEINGQTTGLAGCSLAGNCPKGSVCLRANVKLESRVTLTTNATMPCRYFIPTEQQPHSVLYSPAEASTRGGKGYWSTTAGWTTLEAATRFNEVEAMFFGLPQSLCQDRHWISDPAQ